MFPSQQALLANLLDYAGTFPPARLSRDEALRCAATIRRQAQHPWLLARVVLPLTEIQALQPKLLFDLGADGTPWNFSALGGASSVPNQWNQEAEWELREIRAFNHRGSTGSLLLCISAVEKKLPDLEDEDRVAELSTLFWQSADEILGDGVQPFLESGWKGNWRERLKVLCNSGADCTEDFQHSGLRPGLKFRTGGEYTPTPAELSFAAHQTVLHGFRFKATQGLHHALTRNTPRLEYGFLNLFAALNLAQGLGVEAFGLEMIEACLTDENAGNFEFRSESFRWKNHELSVTQIEQARRLHAGTFGSCSFDEPDAELSMFNSRMEKTR